MQLVKDEALAKLYCRGRINDLEDEIRLKPGKAVSAKKELVALAAPESLAPARYALSVTHADTEHLEIEARASGSQAQDEIVNAMRKYELSLVR